MPEESANMEHALNCLGAELAVEFEIHCFSSGEDFLKHFEPGGFDVVFMDIYMQGMSGTETAAALRHQDSRCILIFLTTSMEHMPEAFACHTFEYIQKPFEPDRIRKVMEDVLRVMPPKARYLTFTSNRQTVRLLYEQFVSAVADDHYVRITDSSGNKYSTRMKFSDFADPLARDKRFLLINKGMLVNMDHITAFGEYGCRMSSGETLPVKVRDRANIEEAWLHYSFSAIRSGQKGRRSLTILNWLQQAVQFLVLIPSAMLCYLPMHRQLRFSPKKSALLAAGTLLVYIPAAAWCAAALGLDCNIILLPSLLLFSVGYRLT